MYGFLIHKPSDFDNRSINKIKPTLTWFLGITVTVAPCRCLDGHVKEPQRPRSACTLMCRHIYDWNIVEYDIKQQIHIHGYELSWNNNLIYKSFYSNMGTLYSHFSSVVSICADENVTTRKSGRLVFYVTCNDISVLCVTTQMRRWTEGVVPTVRLPTPRGTCGV